MGTLRGGRVNGATCRKRGRVRGRRRNDGRVSRNGRRVRSNGGRGRVSGGRLNRRRVNGRRGCVDVRESGTSLKETERERGSEEARSESLAESIEHGIPQKL